LNFFKKIKKFFIRKIERHNFYELEFEANLKRLNTHEKTVGILAICQCSAFPNSMLYLIMCFVAIDANGDA